MAAERPAVLLLHGALGAAASMRPLAERLDGHLTAHTLDFAGHGAARAPSAPLTIELLAAQVSAHIEEHGLAPARIFGYSLGGYVALHLAATRPARVGRVMTLATKLAWSPEVATRMNAQFDPATIRAKVPTLAAALASLHPGMGWEALLGATRTMLADLGDHPRLSPDTYARITQPVRLAVGDRDTTVSIDETLAAMRTIPGAELEVLPATPHLLERMDFDRVSRSTLEFFGARA
jgi:pimeloyl-ACP methyl ester carboxylesterase